jgi:uncharacterized protein YggE
MKHRTSLAAAVVAGALLATPALAQMIPPAAISVTGEATVSVPPDPGADRRRHHRKQKPRARLPTPTTGDGQGAAGAEGAGIEEKDVQTSRLSLQPQSPPNRTGPAAIVSYRASNRVTVRLRDVTKVASVIDTLVGAGANEIGGINFVVTQASKLLDEAREQAIADARRKAEIYARAAGVTLGAPLSISEQGSPGPMPFRKMATGLAASAPVAQGEETLAVTVSVSWAIKAKE